MVRMKTIEQHFGVHVMKIQGKYVAFRGGYGSGQPVQEIAEAYRTDTLWTRVARALAHEQVAQKNS